MKIMKNILLTALTFSLVGAGELFAEAWAVMGPQAVGMGGAFVAVARGSLAQHWNPAGLAQEANFSGLQIPASGGAEFTGGLLNDVHDLSNIASKYSAISSAQQNGSSLNADQMAAFLEGLTALESLNDAGKGVLVNASAGANIKVSRFVVSINNYTSVGGRPFVDTTNIGLGAISGSGGGVTFSAVGVDTTISAANQTAADQIETAINTIGYSDLERLICGSAGCLAAQNGALTSADSLANALVDLAEDSGLTSAQISEAAQTIADNAGTAAVLIDAASSGNSYANNATNLTLRGASFTEFSIGHGRPFILPGLLVGYNIKAILGTVGYERFDVLQSEVDTGDVLSDYNSAAETTIQPGIDLGVLYDLNRTFKILPFRPRVGAVARNINRPSFDKPALATTNGEGSTYKLDSQVRMGLALNPFNFWTLSADLDVTENSTQVPGYKSRMASVGTEINIFNRKWLNIPLRLGLSKNLAQSNSKTAYSAGFGINLLHFVLDMGGSISTETESFVDETGEMQEVPANASVGAQLAFLF